MVGRGVTTRRPTIPRLAADIFPKRGKTASKTKSALGPVPTNLIAAK